MDYPNVDWQLFDCCCFFQEEELLFLQLYTEMLYVSGNTKVYKTLTSIRELVPQP